MKPFSLVEYSLLPSQVEVDKVVPLIMTFDKQISRDSELSTALPLLNF